MLRHMSPTHVVQIRVSPESKNLPSGKFWSDGNENTPVNQIGICGTDNDSSVRSVSTKREARIMRDIRIISYFRQCLPRDFKISSYTELCRCLASIAPIGLPLSSIKVVRLHYQVPSNMIYESLIGSIVGLAVSSLFPNSSRCCTPWCLGLGIVRAVDNLEDRIYVTTPVSRRLLERVDLVFQGSVEVPTCLLQGAAIDRILGEIVHSKSMITPIDYVLCVGHFLAKAEDIYTFFEPELPSKPLNAAKAKASDGCRPSLDRKTSGRSSNSRNNSRSSQSRTQRSQSGSGRRNSFNHNSQRSPQETMSWREGSSVLDLKGENYFSCAVGRKRSNARYLLNSSDEVVCFLKELAEVASHCYGSANPVGAVFEFHAQLQILELLDNV